MTLSACSSEDEPTPPGGDTSAKPDATGGSALEKLSGDQLCELLPSASIERDLATTVEESESTERGRAPAMETPYFLTRECDYKTSTFNLSTEVNSEWDEDAADKDVLDSVFTDPTVENPTPGEYEQVPDLGTVAGFGPDAVLAGADVAGVKLGVVFTIGEERLSLTVHTLGKAELAQLRPLTEELLTGLQETLG
ncbi:hypothetical protein [Actinophytocola sediminis]